MSDKANVVFEIKQDGEVIFYLKNGMTLNLKPNTPFHLYCDIREQDASS